MNTRLFTTKCSAIKIYKNNAILKQSLLRPFVSYNYRASSSISSLTSNCCLYSQPRSLEENNENGKSSAFSKRPYSSDSNDGRNKLPELMSFQKIVWPSVIKSIRNFILASFIIKPYFDRDFNLPDFVLGSKKAVEVVSHKIAEGDVKSLEGLVTSDIVPSLQRSVSLMSLPQREELAINMDDIYFSFPYQVGIIFNDDESSKDQKRFVEITMVYHALRGLGLMRSRGEEPPINMGMIPEFQAKISICNYRFVKEFTKGVESDWTVNLLNHFKTNDTLE